MNQAGIPIKIEPVEDGIIIYHKATTDFAKNLRLSLAPFVKFADENQLPSDYVEIFNSMTAEKIYVAADNEQYVAMCANVIRLLAKNMKETENPLTLH